MLAFSPSGMLACLLDCLLPFLLACLIACLHSSYCIGGIYLQELEELGQVLKQEVAVEFVTFCVSQIAESRECSLQ